MLLTILSMNIAYCFVAYIWAYDWFFGPQQAAAGLRLLVRFILWLAAPLWVGTIIIRNLIDEVKN
jgi:hypothetical protein